MTNMAILFFVYASLVELEGVARFRASGSSDALVRAVIPGALLYLAVALVWLAIPAGFYLGLIVTMVLIVMYGRRFGQTQQFMTSGLMLVLSAIVLGVLVSIVT